MKPSNLSTVFLSVGLVLIAFGTNLVTGANNQANAASGCKCGTGGAAQSIAAGADIQTTCATGCVAVQTCSSDAVNGTGFSCVNGDVLNNCTIETVLDNFTDRVWNFKFGYICSTITGSCEFIIFPPSRVCSTVTTQMILEKSCADSM
jgi:hypothetical protein